MPGDPGAGICWEENLTFMLQHIVFVSLLFIFWGFLSEILV